MAEEILETQEKELIKKTVKISRVSKVVKGGKRMSFTAICVVGDGEGHVGVAKCKGSDVRIALDKAFKKAEQNMVKINVHGTTIPHTVIGRQCRSFVLMKPARPGTGIIASQPVRAVLEACGINDVLTKCIGSRNIMNVCFATFKGLLQLKRPDEKLTGKKEKVSQKGRSEE